MIGVLLGGLVVNHGVDKNVSVFFIFVFIVL